MNLKELPKQIISGVAVAFVVAVRVAWEILVLALGEAGAFISMCITAAAVVAVLRYAGVL